MQANQAFTIMKQRQVMGKVMILPESKSASPVSRLWLRHSYLLFNASTPMYIWLHNKRGKMEGPLLSHLHDIHRTPTSFQPNLYSWNYFYLTANSSIGHVKQLAITSEQNNFEDLEPVMWQDLQTCIYGNSICPFLCGVTALLVM